MSWFVLFALQFLFCGYDLTTQNIWFEVPDMLLTASRLIPTDTILPIMRVYGKNEKTFSSGTYFFDPKIRMNSGVFSSG